MPDYSQGKIYKIEPLVEHEEGDIYVGSTTQKYLSDRMGEHRGHFRLFNEGRKNYVSSYVLFQKYGIENCMIYLIENVNAKDKNELNAREGYYIQTLKCINRYITGRNQKQYRSDNKEKLLENAKQYYTNKKDERLKYAKQHYIDNKEKIIARTREYNTNNKIAINCPCGSTIQKCSMKYHTYSKKHQAFLLNNHKNKI